MNFLHRTPFFRLLFPLILGIGMYRLVEPQNWMMWVVSVFSLILVAASGLIVRPTLQYKFRWLFGTGIFLLFIIVGVWLSKTRENENKFSHLRQKGVFQVELTEAPVEKAKSYLCKVKLLKSYANKTSKPAHGKAILYIQKDSGSSGLLFGDRLMIGAEFTPPEKPLNPDGFDYAAYLKHQGIMATCYIQSGNWQKMDRNNSFSIRRLAGIAQNYLLGIYRRFHIQGDEFAVLAALTLGYTDALQPDLRASYSATGAMHILSVSGLHVGVVYIVFAFLLGFMNKSQQLKVIKALIICVLLWGYAFLTGLSPAVVRATLMFTFVNFGSALDRKSQMYNTIFMSAFFMLLINPDFLFDVGFQLSYAAVLSIIFFQPPFSELLPVRNKFLRFFRDLFTVSVAAQLGTAPFTLYYFHQFPNYFLLTNLVAIPLSTLVIYLAIALLMVSFVPYLSMLVVFLLKWSLWLMNFLIVWIQNLPHSLSVLSFDVRQMIFLFIALFCLSAYFYSKKFVALVVGLASVLVVVMFSFMFKYETMHSSKLIVFAGQKSTHVSFIDRNMNYVYSGDAAEFERIAGSYWKTHEIEKPVRLVRTDWYSDGYALFQNKRILILQEGLLKSRTLFLPLDVDFLIIGNHLKAKMDQVLESIHPRQVIVDKSISKWYVENIRQACSRYGIPFYSVAEQGAYILNFTH